MSDCRETPLQDETGAAFAVDGDGRIADANDSCAVVFEQVVEELLDRGIASMVDSGYFEEEFLEFLGAALDGEGGERTFRTSIRPGGTGDPHTYEVVITPVESGAICTLRDVGTQYRYEETVDSLNGVTRKLMAADTRLEVLAETGDAANEVLGFPGVGVRMYDPDEELLRHVSFGGVVNEIDARPPFGVEDSPHGRAFRTGETVVEEIPDEDDPFDREVFSHTMYVPIGESGLLSLGRIGGPFDRADVHFAEILAENARAALQQVERKQRLREQRRRLQERNERLDEFASVVSHDLRNPLGVAMGAVEAYRATDDDQWVDDVEYALDRMDDIIDEILELAREGISEGDLEPVSLTATARAAWRNVAAEGVRMEVAEETAFEADPDRIQRLCENLFRNSVEHGETVTTIEVGPVSDDEGFYVADDGVGIDPDQRDQVFESGYTDAEDGTGYGLAIVARIAADHGFEVDVTDSVSGGARFEVLGIEPTEDA